MWSIEMVLAVFIDGFRNESDIDAFVIEVVKLLIEMTG